MNNTKTATIAKTDTIEWDVIEGENTEFTAQYPRMQWVHGSKIASGFMKTGGLFVSKEQYPNFTGEGFEPAMLITRGDGPEIEGYAASATKLAVIRIKDQWIKDDNGRNVPLCHVLCCVKGCDDLLNISLRGAAKSLDFQKAFKQHIGQNIALANRTRPEGEPTMEPFGLWFPLIAGEPHNAGSKDGKSQSMVTSPEMQVPEILDYDYIVSLWIGVNNYKLFTGFYKETEVWKKQPIWEQRNNDENGGGSNPDELSHSGPDRATQGQIEHIVGLCEAKGLDIKELILTATNDATDNPGMLTRVEASEIIETAKAY